MIDPRLELDPLAWSQEVLKEYRAYLVFYPGNPKLARRLAVSYVAQRFRRTPVGG